MLRRLFIFLIVVPLAILLIVFAVANRHMVSIALDPFSPETPAVEVAVPVFLLVFGTLILGVLIGGIASWFSQGKWRRMAREHRDEAARWRYKASKLGERIQDQGRALAAPLARRNS